MRSTDSPTKETPRPESSRPARLSWGPSTRQAGHHVAQKFSTTTSPWWAASVKGSPELRVTASAGAGSPGGGPLVPAI